MKVKFINGSWKNDDVDLLPTIKMRHSRKQAIEHSIEIRLTSIAFCWLKWGIMFSFVRSIQFEYGFEEMGE